MFLRPCTNRKVVQLQCCPGIQENFRLLTNRQKSEVFIYWQMTIPPFLGMVTVISFFLLVLTVFLVPCSWSSSQ